MIVVEDPEAPPVERFRELHRLSYVVRKIDHDCALVPGGAVVVDAGKRVVFSPYYGVCCLMYMQISLTSLLPLSSSVSYNFSPSLPFLSWTELSDTVRTQSIFPLS